MIVSIGCPSSRRSQQFFLGGDRETWEFPNPPRIHDTSGNFRDIRPTCSATWKSYFKHDWSTLPQDPNRNLKPSV